MYYSLVSNGIDKSIEPSLSYGCDSGRVDIGVIFHSLEEISAFDEHARLRLPVPQSGLIGEV